MFRSIFYYLIKNATISWLLDMNNMSHKVELRKGIYNLVGQILVPKRC
jgi:hypothetical protein